MYTATQCAIIAVQSQSRREVLPIDKTNPEYFPAYRLVAAFAEDAHGDITWFDGVTDQYYENGRFYAAIPPPPHSPFPIIDPTGDPDFEQQSLL